MINVATPLTFERITGNRGGSITGWKLTPEQAGAKIPRTLPGLENFWMIGNVVKLSLMSISKSAENY